MSSPTLRRQNIIDSHVHFLHPEKTGQIIEIMQYSGCAQIHLVCIPNLDGTTLNHVAMDFKKQLPQQIYVSAALEYAPILTDPVNASAILAGQVRQLIAAGYDGLKMIEGKPNVRKMLPYPLDGAIYRTMWQTLEQEQFPVLLHIADPDEFWNNDLCPAWARDFGWDYSDGTFPAKETLYQEVQHILARHPRLRLILAHFGFLSKDLSRAARLLDSYPHLYLDLAPHAGMYTDFSLNHIEARTFFIQYAARILYGTDLDTRTLSRGEHGKAFSLAMIRMVQNTLEQPGKFATDTPAPLNALGLPPQVLEQIYHQNFHRLYGELPKEIP